GPGPSSYEEHRYPFAGGPNAIVRLGVVRASGGETIWMDTGEADSYLARVHFTASGGLAAELESRDQHTLDLVRLDLQSGRSTLVHREQHPVWINLHDDFWALEAGENEGAFVWSSERSGFRHLELRGADGGLIRVLTGGAWAVDRLEAVDEHTGLVYFSGADNSPTERHLYSVPLMGGAVARVTTEAGTHDVVVDHACRFFADRHSSLAKPPTVTVRAIFDRSVHCVLHRCRDRRIDELELAPPELVTLDTDDGSTLYGLLYEPASHLLGDPPPLVVQVYGGPHAQLARDDWAATVSLRAQALRKLGCSVLTVDNRGSARRGIDFEAPIRFLTGHVEVADQVAGVRFAVSRGAADPDRVAVFGWSYGGYMALMCLARAGETFKAAVAGAPVTHWDGYDTHYTERYMSTPAANPQGYDSSSVLAHIGVIKGALLIVHGLIDENVHFRHTARLVNHLLRAQKPHRLLLYPTERHLPRRQRDRAWMEEQVITWLIEHLS
ncbi:MAG: alpha/beta fold hydrolase, partial [Acidimicrobiales bacterium]